MICYFNQCSKGAGTQRYAVSALLHFTLWRAKTFSCLPTQAAGTLLCPLNLRLCVSSSMNCITQGALRDHQLFPFSTSHNVSGLLNARLVLRQFQAAYSLPLFHCIVPVLTDFNGFRSCCPTHRVHKVTLHGSTRFSSRTEQQKKR